jgi:uncharacterized protein YkwD
MKKLFLSQKGRFLTSGIFVLFTLGAVVSICLTGITPLHAQQADIASRPTCKNAGDSIFRMFNLNGACGQISSPNENKRTSPSNSSPTGQYPAYLKNPNAWSNPNHSQSPNPISTPTDKSNCPNSRPTHGSASNPSTKDTPEEQTNSQNGEAQNNFQDGQTQANSSDTVTQAAQAVFNQINSARAQAGLSALQWSTQLVNSAHNHNLAMQSANQMSHQLPNEPDLGTRISQAGVKWSSVGENIGYSTDYLNPANAATGLNQDMLNEQPPNDGHRQNILSKSFTTVGVDVFVDTTNHKVWLTEDFAHSA